MKLKLQSSIGMGIVECELKEMRGSAVEIDSSFEGRHIDTNQYVYSDSAYTGTIEIEERFLPTQIRCYLNGEALGCTVFFDNNSTNAHVDFKSEQYPFGNIFRDCYGYIQIEVECVWDSDQNAISYKTDYIGVMLRANKENEAIQKMAEFVYENHDKFLWRKNTSPSGLVEMTKTTKKNLDAQIELIKAVQNVFERNLQYMRINAHTRSEIVYRRDDFEKLRQTSSKVLQYIAQHPDDFVSTDVKTGIFYKNRNVYPKKTLVQSSERILDTYENRIIMGFLCHVIEIIDELKKNIQIYLDSHTNSTIPIHDGYILSTTYILQSTRHHIGSKLKELELLGTKATELYWTYKQIFPFECERITTIPKASAVFRSVVVYRQFYDAMYRWFLFGCYDFSNERFMLPLLINNQIYEYYLLLKLAGHIIETGFHLCEDQCRCFEYPVQYHRYKGTEHNNTFVFENSSGESITLFFQPVLWGQQYSELISNGISLCRTTSLSIGKEGTLSGFRPSTNTFYTPDYLLKYSYKGKERYIILDAKLSARDTVVKNQVASIAFKYQFSVQPKSIAAELLGVVLLYGKGINDECRLQSVHDVYNNPNSPFFFLSSFTESDKCTDESKKKTMDSMLQQYLAWNK